MLRKNLSFLMSLLLVSFIFLVMFTVFTDKTFDLPEDPGNYVEVESPNPDVYLVDNTYTSLKSTIPQPKPVSNKTKKSKVKSDIKTEVNDDSFTGYEDQYDVKKFRKEIKSILLTSKDVDNKRGIELVKEYNEYLDAISSDKPRFTYKDLYYLSHMVYRENGHAQYEVVYLTAVVAYNRTYKSDKYPDTLVGVITEKGQYSTYNSGLFKVLPNKLSVKASLAVLLDEVTVPENVVYQATFLQGSGEYDSFEVKGQTRKEYFCFY